MKIIFIKRETWWNEINVECVMSSSNSFSLFAIHIERHAWRRHNQQGRDAEWKINSEEAKGHNKIQKKKRICAKCKMPRYIRSKRHWAANNKTDRNAFCTYILHINDSRMMKMKKETFFFASTDEKEKNCAKLSSFFTVLSFCLFIFLLIYLEK